MRRRKLGDLFGFCRNVRRFSILLGSAVFTFFSVNFQFCIRTIRAHRHDCCTPNRIRCTAMDASWHSRTHTHTHRRFHSGSEPSLSAARLVLSPSLFLPLAAQRCWVPLAFHGCGCRIVANNRYRPSRSCIVVPVPRSASTCVESSRKPHTDLPRDRCATPHRLCWSLDMLH